MTKIWAHRGAGGWDTQYAPENTMPAFQKAVEMGADDIELDVQLTKDGELVVCHDETIDRTSDGKGAVQSYTLRELRQFSFCSVHKEYGFVAIPTLADVLAFMRQHDFALNIELKTGLAYYEGIEEKTADMVRAEGLSDRVLYSSFNYYSLQRLRAYDKTARIAILCAADYTRIPEDAERIRAEAIHPAHGFVTADYVARCHAAGLMVNVWTVDNPERMKEMLAAGADGIITDCPDTGRKILGGVSAPI